MVEVNVNRFSEVKRTKIVHYVVNPKYLLDKKT